MNGDDSAATRRRLVRQLRAALLSLLSDGSWRQIEEDHAKVGLPWRSDLEPGSGKPRYVGRVLDDLPDDEIVAVARRALDRLTGRSLFAVQDALLWFDAEGVMRVSEVTRIAVAAVLDGRRLHPNEQLGDVLERFALARTDLSHFAYSENGDLVEVQSDFSAFFGLSTPKPPTTRTSSHLALLDRYGFRAWPDSRLFQFLEYLVHPTVRRDQEQASLVLSLNAVLAADGVELFAGESLSGHPVFAVRPIVVGVSGRPKNLIFASIGPKPELGFVDAVNNDIVILRHAEHCLVYDQPITDDGLRWTTLVEWWAVLKGLDPREATTRIQLGERLRKSLASEPERRFFNAYFKAVRPLFGDAMPALVPQVYLHYDPMTLRELRARGDGGRFDVQRMDFLLLLPHAVRVIIEIDGQQHYATGTEVTARPSPEEYARTARSDRHLRLAGYEVYRFGGYELPNENTSATVVEDFFTRLFRRHKLVRGPAAAR